MKSIILLYPLPYLALLTANIIWGGTPVIAKLALQEFPIGTLAFLRFFLAFLLLLPFILTVKQKDKIQTGDWPKFVGLGLLIVTFHIFFFFTGVKKTTAIDASVLALIVPIISVVVGWWFLREKIYWINLIGIILGMIGAVINVGLPLIFVGSLTSEALIGNILIVLSSLCFVGGAILSRMMLKTYSALTLTWTSFLIGSLTFLPLAVVELANDPTWFTRVSLIGSFGLVYVTLLSSICAYFLFNWSLVKIGVVRADLIQYIQPAVSASLAIPILNERISYSFVVGTCLIVLGVYWGTLGKSEHHHHHLHHQRS